MTTIFLLARKQRATFGHGDYGHELVLGDDYFPPRPAFASTEAAAKYLVSLEAHQRTDVEIVPVELR